LEKNFLGMAFLVVAFLETAFLGKKIPWSVVQPRFSSFYMENQKAVNLFEFKRNV
jgi:hypothetical protein